MWVYLKKKISDGIFGGLPGEPIYYTFLSLLFGGMGLLLHPLFFGLALLMDVIDGAVARAHRLSTPKGAVMDGISDRVVDFLMVLKLIPYTCSPVLLGLCFFSCFTSYVPAYFHHRGLKPSYTPGRVLRSALIWMATLFPHPLLIYGALGIAGALFLVRFVAHIPQLSD